MTANEMRNLFKELYDGASAQEMGFDDIEVSRFLNLAQDILLNEFFFTNRNYTLEGFEQSSKRDVQLNNLKRSATLWFDVNANSWILRTYNNIALNTDVEIIEDEIINFPAVIYEIPSEILYIVNDNVDIKNKNTGELIRNIQVKNVNEDNLNDVLNNPFLKPHFTVVYRSLQKLQSTDDDEHKIVKLYLPEGYKFNRWNVTYIKRPNRIVVDILNPDNQVNCELDSLIHNDIVFKAVELAMGSIGSQKFQIANYNTNKNVN